MGILSDICAAMVALGQTEAGIRQGEQALAIARALGLLRAAVSYCGEIGHADAAKHAATLDRIATPPSSPAGQKVSSGSSSN